MKKHKINKLLKEWGERSLEHQEDTSDLIRSIQTGIRNEPSPRRSMETVEERAPRRPYAVGMATAAATAVVVAGIFLTWPIFENTGRKSTAADITIRQKETREKQALMAEMDNVFESGLQWISESSNDVQVNVADSFSEQEQAGDGVPVLLKVMLLRQTNNGKRSQEMIWKGDIIARSEQVITVTPNPETSDNTITFWLYPLNNSGVLVDFELSFKKPFELCSSSANHIVTEQPSRVLSAGNGKSEYKMYLAATPLKETDAQKSCSVRKGVRL